MSKSARLIITEEMEVEVSQFKQLNDGDDTDLEGVLTFKRHIAEEGPVQKYGDVFSVKDEDTMKILLEDRSGDRVFATVAPDVSDDNDGHPEIIAARILKKDEQQA